MATQKPAKENPFMKMALQAGTCSNWSLLYLKKNYPPGAEGRLDITVYGLTVPGTGQKLTLPLKKKIMIQYYPLAAGNKWEYKQKDGSVYNNTVLSVDGNLVTMKNSTLPETNVVKVENGTMYNELMGKGNFQIWLKDDLKPGDIWEASFSANGLDSVLCFTVKEAGISKEVEGKTYNDVVMVEAESKIKMNGNLISTRFLTQYYYAKGTGLILTTSSMGDYHGLVSCSLN